MPPDNRNMLSHLFDEGKINIKRGAIFDASPKPMPDNLDFDRIEGMLLGLAVGDALGNTTEGMRAGQRAKLYGEIRNYLPNRHAGLKEVGLPTDDTQLAFWTLEQLIEDRGFVPKHVADRISSGRIFGIGSTVRRFLLNYEHGIPWFESGPKSAGNGALMRIAPMLCPHLKADTIDFWVDTALCAMMTHNDTASISSCLWFVRALWDLVLMQAPPAPEWWLETYVNTVQDLEAGSRYRPRGGDFTDYEGPMWAYVKERVEEAYRQGLSVRQACDSWYSGAYLMETVPAVIYILSKHGHDFEEAIIRAVNDTKDNDTIAAIVGAAVGALHGRKNIPARWLESLPGRTTADDDGKIYELLEGVRKTCG